MRLQPSALSWAFVAFSTLGLLPAVNAEPGRHTVLVMLQNLARAPSAPVELAQAEAARLYAPIGVDVVWVTEVPRPPSRLRVVCLTTMEPPRELNVADSAVGYTLLPLGKRAIRTYVFWQRVERAARNFGTVVDKVLAIAIAHELGHMLLPDGSHAESGLMAGPWNPSHFRSAAAGLLVFSKDSAELIRRELERDAATPVASSSVR